MCVCVCMCVFVRVCVCVCLCVLGMVVVHCTVSGCKVNDPVEVVLDRVLENSSTRLPKPAVEERERCVMPKKFP